MKQTKLLFSLIILCFLTEAEVVYATNPQAISKERQMIPAVATSPTDATSPAVATSPTDATSPAVATSPTDASSPTDATSPADATSPTDATTPAVATSPTDATTPVTTQPPAAPVTTTTTTTNIDNDTSSQSIIFTAPAPSPAPTTPEVQTETIVPVAQPTTVKPSKGKKPVKTRVTVQPEMVSPNASPHTNPKPESSAAHHKSNSSTTDPWKFTIAPYVWGMNLNGYVNVGTRGARINESFNDILEDFKGGGMLWLELEKGRWGVFLNSLYAYLDRQFTVGRINLKPIFKYGLFTAGASYEVYNKTFSNCTNFALQPYIGARYTINDAKIEVLNTRISASSNQQWVDPIIGARINYTIDRNWLTVFAGDIGGTGGNQKSYNLNAYLGYKPTTKCLDIKLYGGYRLLYQKYVHSTGGHEYIWKMHLFGPVVGIAFTF